MLTETVLNAINCLVQKVRKVDFKKRFNLKMLICDFAIAGVVEHEFFKFRIFFHEL